MSSVSAQIRLSNHARESQSAFGIFDDIHVDEVEDTRGETDSAIAHCISSKAVEQIGGISRVIHQLYVRQQLDGLASFLKENHADVVDERIVGEVPGVVVLVVLDVVGIVDVGEPRDRAAVLVHLAEDHANAAGADCALTGLWVKDLN